MVLLRRLRGSSLLVRFAVASLLLTIAVGSTLSWVLGGLVSDRARHQAESAVVVAVRLGLQPQLRAEDFPRGFDPTRLSHVEQAMAADDDAGVHTLDDLDPVTVKMFNRDGLLVYSDQRELIGKQVDSPDLRAALSGVVLSKFTSPQLEEEAAAGRDTRLLEVYVPVQFDGSSVADGVMEVYLPYEPIAAAIRQDVRTLNVVLVASLAGLYLALFRLVATASGRLTRQTEALRVSADRNEYQALHDALTGMPNRALFRDRLQTALADARRTDSELAVMLLDLDRFKEINDTLGHSHGDALLCQVGPRLRSVLREGDTVARFGGDEFAVLLPTVEGQADARAVAARMLEALHRSFEVGDIVLDVEASIGIALSPWHGGDMEDLLRNADIAMYVAKDVKAGAVLFDPAEHVTAPLRLSVLGDLRRALDRDDELVLHYQPKYALDGARFLGAEALLRWHHPERGLVPPGEFIPVAEGTGIIGPLTERVLELALAQQRAWLDAGHRVPVAVNLSTRCLLDAQLPGLVDRLLRCHEVPAALLRLEVTETAVMGDTTRSMEVLRRLRSLGVHLSIDDFGTGYSSMAHLRRLPVDELKIDRSFVIGMTATEQDAVLVRTAVDLGHNLGMTVVAEGVETAEHLDALRALGCDVAQGYHCARPMPAADLTALLGAPAEGGMVTTSGAPA